MNLYKQFGTDEKQEKDGIVLDYGSCKIRIARAGGGNSRFDKAMKARSKPYRRQIDNETLPDDVSKKVMVEIYTDTVVLGWEGVTDAKGKKMEFNRENCVKLLTDLPELLRDIQEQANKSANFRAEDLEEDKKN